MHGILELATTNCSLSPLQGRHAKLHLSLYADDTIIFINPIHDEVNTLFGILEHFCSVTGLKLNLSKCIVAPIRCGNLDLDHILRNFVGTKVNLTISYLGLPLTLGRLKVVHIQGFIDKARSKLAGWQGQLLNPAGRRELVRSVLCSMPTYLLTSIKAPRQLTAGFDKIRRRFLWAGSNEIT